MSNLLEIPENKDVPIYNFNLPNIPVKEIEYVKDTHIIIHMDNNNRIKLYLSSQRECCESFGIIFSEDFTQIVGSTINHITCGKEEYTKDNYYGDKYKNQIILLLYTLEKKEPYQACLCNIHNGYYPHDFEIIFTVDNKEHMILKGCL